MTFNRNSSAPSDSPLVEFYDAEIQINELLEEQKYIDPQLIKKGGIKEVYKVTDTHCAREVAYATIRKQSYNLENTVNFLREVQIASGFEHPNIIRIYDVGIDGEKPWFTMELSSGKNLEEWLEETTEISLAEKLEVFIQLCDAVHYAHERDVIHLDLKPANVAIGKQGQVLLTDWGIASSLLSGSEEEIHISSSVNRDGYITGSLGYMAPEQASENITRSKASDIFGLGGILHFLLTSEPPIGGDTFEEKIHNTKTGICKSLRRKEIPERLIPILEKALLKNAEQRYHTAQELQQEVESYRNGYTTYAESASLWFHLFLFAMRNKALVAVILVSAITLGGVSFKYLQSIKASENLAKEARDEALIKQAEAEKALAQYFLTKDLRKTDNQDYAETLYEVAMQEMASYDFEAALASAKDSAERDPNNAWLLKRLGVIHFIRQEFAEAEKYLRFTPDRNMKLANIAGQYKEKKSPLAINEFNQLLDKVDYPFIKLCLIRFDAKKRPPKHHSLTVAQLLKKQAKPLNFKYNAKKKTLSLKGSQRLKSVYYPATKYSPPTNLLKTLPIKHLILDDTKYFRDQAERRFRPNWNCRVTFQ